MHPLVQVLAMADPSLPPDIASLLNWKPSLRELSEQKPRLVTGLRSPHEMPHLIRDVYRICDACCQPWCHARICVSSACKRQRMYDKVWDTTCVGSYRDTLCMPLGVSRKAFRSPFKSAHDAVARLNLRPLQCLMQLHNVAYQKNTYPKK
ncbi:hypothetical protein OG21DRAFT_636032 [Imleria badia]|nr:hypothetical protein OG21DRAFT_636032 [Imleria badia]